MMDTQAHKNTNIFMTLHEIIRLNILVFRIRAYKPFMLIENNLRRIHMRIERDSR